MADQEEAVILEEEVAADAEMGEAEAEENDGDEGAAGGLEDIQPTIPERTTFLEWVPETTSRGDAMTDAARAQLFAIAHRRVEHWHRRRYHDAFGPSRPSRGLVDLRLT